MTEWNRTTSGIPNKWIVQDINTFTTDGNWNVASNWSHNAVPAADSSVLIAANATIDRPCYTIQTVNGVQVIEAATNPTLHPCEGVMVQADAEHESVTFTKVTPDAQANQPNNGSLQIALTQANTRSNALLDKAIMYSSLLTLNSSLPPRGICFAPHQRQRCEDAENRIVLIILSK